MHPHNAEDLDDQPLVEERPPARQRRHRCHQLFSFQEVYYLVFFCYIYFLGPINFYDASTFLLYPLLCKLNDCDCICLCQCGCYGLHILLLTSMYVVSFDQFFFSQKPINLFTTNGYILSKFRVHIGLFQGLVNFSSPLSLQIHQICSSFQLSLEAINSEVVLGW